MNEVEIPIPPSNNHLWRAVSTRNQKIRLVKEARYKSWIEPTVFLLRAGLPRFPGRVKVVVTVRGGVGFPERRDADNCLKPVIDALRFAGRIPDDSVKVVVEATVRYEEPADRKQKAACFVRVEAVDFAARAAA